MFTESAALFHEFDCREVLGRWHEADDCGNAQEGHYEDGGEFPDGWHLKLGLRVADGEVTRDIQRMPAVKSPVDTLTSVAIS